MFNCTKALGIIVQPFALSGNQLMEIAFSHSELRGERSQPIKNDSTHSDGPILPADSFENWINKNYPSLIMEG